jgi:hypothetical protein
MGVKYPAPAESAFGEIEEISQTGLKECRGLSGMFWNMKS